MALEHEAEVIPKVVALVRAAKLHRESKDSMIVRRANDDPATEGALRHDILRYVIKVKEGVTAWKSCATRCRRGGCWGQRRAPSARRRTSRDEAFGNLVDDFGTLPNVEDRVEDRLYARKERLRRGHTRSLAAREKTRETSTESRVATEKKGHVQGLALARLDIGYCRT